MEKYAILFPGQGSQSVGMLNAFEADYAPVLSDVFKRASKALNEDLWEIVSQNSRGLLDQTQYTQPALLAASYVLWCIWQKTAKAKPSFLAGHSLGEYTALVCAEALSFDDAIALVSLRGRLMQEAVPEGVGAMAAIVGLSDEAVVNLCKQVSAKAGTVSAANYNAIGQVVISGYHEAVLLAVEEAKAQGAKIAKVLPVSVPSHCALMKPAAEALGDALERIALHTPRYPIIHNATVDIVEHPDDIRQRLVEQLYQPVRWVETVQRLVAEGVSLALECGPGNVLTGLNKRISADLKSIALKDPNSLKQESQSS
ncbi:MAG: ACP S-malonyltransferase [Gammaproteobacteria bacterium]|nr:ACP S-malonyltransferase [Gammaproteobacteria bacterium]